MKAVGGDAAESGDGAGSYDVRGMIWHVNYGNPEIQSEGGWMIFNAILGVRFFLLIFFPSARTLTNRFFTFCSGTTLETTALSSVTSSTGSPSPPRSSTSSSRRAA